MLFLLDPAATYLSMTVRHGRGASGHWPFLPLPAFSSSASLLPPLAALGSAVSPAHCAGLPAWKIHRSQSHRKKAPLGCFLRLSKKWLAPLFRGFHSSLAPTARPGSYAGKPLLRKAFCGFAVHAAKSDESLKGLRSSIRQRFLDKLRKHP